MEWWCYDDDDMHMQCWLMGICYDIGTYADGDCDADEEDKEDADRD